MKSNSNRKLILEAIQARQGIHKSEICRLTGLPWGTATHHLRMLVAAGAIRSFRVGTQIHFATADEVRTNRIGRALLMPHSRAILDLLQAGGVHGPSSLAQRLEASPKVIRRHCTLLVEEGHLESDGGYHPRFWLAGQEPGSQARQF